MKKIKCYGKKKLRPVDTSTHKAIFADEKCEINNSKSVSYNLRLRKNEAKAKEKEISKGSIFNSFSFISNLYPSNIQPKKNVTKKPVKNKLPISKLKDTSWNKIIQAGLDVEDESRISQGSHFRGSLFRTSSTGYFQKLSTCRSKRNLRTRPIKSMRRKTLVLKTKQRKSSLMKKECKISLRNRRISRMLGKGKRKKKFIVKSRKSSRHVDSYIKEVNENFSKLDQYKLTVEHHSKKKKVDVEKDKRNLSLDLDTKNNAAAENLTSNIKDLSFNQIDRNEKKITKSAKKKYTPTTRKKVNISALSPISLDNTIHKKDKYDFHKKSHTTPLKCSKKLNENLSRVSISKINAEGVNVEQLSKTFHSNKVLLEKKKSSYLQQNAQSSFFKKKPIMEPCVNVSRLSISILKHYKVNLSLLNAEKSDQIRLKSQVKSKKKAKNTYQQKIKIKQEVEDVTIVESTNEPHTSPLKINEISEQYPIAEPSKRKLRVNVNKLNLSKLDLKKLKVSKVNIPELSVAETKKKIPQSQAKLKNIRKKVTGKKGKNIDQQEVEDMATLVSTNEPKMRILKPEVAEQYPRAEPSKKELCLRLTMLDHSKLDLKELNITKVNVPELIAETNQNIALSPAKSKNIRRKGRKKKKITQKKAKNTDQQKIKEHQKVEDVVATLVSSKEPKKSILKPPPEVAEQNSLTEPSKKEPQLKLTKLDFSKLDLKKFKITKVNFPQLTVSETNQNISLSPAKSKNIRRKGRKKKKITQKKAKNTDQQKIKDQQEVEDVPTLVSKECQKNTSKSIEGVKHYSPLIKDHVNLAKVTQSKLVTNKVDLSLSTTHVSKLEKGKENKKIMKKTGKQRKGMKDIINKKKLFPTNSSIIAPLQKNITKLYASKQANEEVIKPIKSKIIEKNKDMENYVSASSSSSITAKKQEFDVAELNVSDQIVEKSHVNPSLNEIGDNDATLESNENSLRSSNFSTPKAFIIRTKQKLADEKLAMKKKKKIEIVNPVPSCSYSVNPVPSCSYSVNPVPSCSYSSMNSLQIPDPGSSNILSVNTGKNIDLRDPPLPVTSTPVTHKKKLLFPTPMQLFQTSPEQEKSTNFPNVSGIFSSNISRNKKREIGFEGLLLDEVDMNKISPRNVRSLDTHKRDLVSKVYNRNIPHDSYLLNQPKKSYSNNVPIFLKSQTCLKSVNREESKSNDYLKPLFVLCKQDGPLLFKDIYDWQSLKIEKVGEGSYGEVFLLKNLKQKVIIKVIPISRDPADKMQTAQSVFSEIKVSACLNNLRDDPKNKTKNFNLLREAWIIKDRFPEILLEPWDKFKAKKTSYNERPDVYDDEQIYAMLELEYGGEDLSKFKLKNALESESILKQIAISLAIAEDTYLFEHRDLHVGNILVERTKCKKVSYMLRGSPISIPSNGVLVNIIDFTLSRILEYGIVFYNNLADDEELFNQIGDEQFDVYRATREQLKNNWQECLLFSNVLWLQYICSRLQKQVYTHPTTVTHQRSMEKIIGLGKILPKCKRALDIIIKCDIASVPAEIDAQLIQLNAIAKYIDKRSLMN